MAPDLNAIRERYNPSHNPIDLMLVHLGGTMIPSPTLSPLAFMVTMDGPQGVQLMRLIEADVTIPIHYDDYEVFARKDSRGEVERAGLERGVVVLDKGECYRFRVRGEVGRGRSEEAYFGGRSSP